MELSRDDLQVLDTWIQLPGLNVKYWAPPSLSIIVSQIGNPKMIDRVTAARDRMEYARVLMEVKINPQLPVFVTFENQFGVDVIQQIFYEWKPVFCNHCSMFGHDKETCRKKGKLVQRWFGKMQLPMLLLLLKLLLILRHHWWKGPEKRTLLRQGELLDQNL